MRSPAPKAISLSMTRLNCSERSWSRKKPAVSRPRTSVRSWLITTIGTLTIWSNPRACGRKSEYSRLSARRPTSGTVVLSAADDPSTAPSAPHSTSRSAFISVR